MSNKRPCKYATSKSMVLHTIPYGMIHAKARKHASAGSNMECAGILTHAAINIQITNVAKRFHLNSNRKQVQPIESLLVDAIKRPATVTMANLIKQPIQNGFAHTTSKANARSLTTIARSSTTQHVGTTQMGGARKAKSASSLTVTGKAHW